MGFNSGFLQHIQIVILSLLALTLVAESIDLSAPSSRYRLGPCQNCRVLVTSFNNGLEKTAKGHYGGGDTAWEEENKKNYKNSELRLTEIQENLCKEISSGTDQCHSLAEEAEHFLEEWWGTPKNLGEDLYDWLCIKQLKACCPVNHFGPDCTPCPGTLESPCSGHGKCKGNGTRKGSGECSCDVGYAGKLCDSCAGGYYEAYKDDTKHLCSACHKACDGGCSGPGSQKCNSCKQGWENGDAGCSDINECLLESNVCKRNEFCVNTEGSHSCIACDKACDSCYGDGPDMCERCAKGYTLKDNICIDESASVRHDDMQLTRYATYFGMCLATCIIFQKNTLMAGIVGSAVAAYIGASEYLLTHGYGIRNEIRLLER